MYRFSGVFLFIVLCPGLVSGKALQWHGITDQQYVDQLVACQLELKRYDWSKTIWPAAQLKPKPDFAAVVNEQQVRQLVMAGIYKQTVLAEWFNIRIDAALLQHDINRMMRHSKDPQALRGLFAVLGDDPATIAHCLSRPYLVDSKLRQSFAQAADIHQGVRLLAQREIDSFRKQAAKTRNSRMLTYLLDSANDLDEQASYGHHVVTLDALEFDATISRIHLQAGSLQEHRKHFSYHQVVAESADSLTIEVLTWQKQSLDQWLKKTVINLTVWLPDLRQLKPLDKHDSPNAFFNNGRAAPVEPDSWEHNFKVPAERSAHTAVWTGTEMIIWGGGIGGIELNTGGRYNPATDSWTELSVDGAPIARDQHIAVWTGNEMVIWGGRYLFNGLNYLRSGGRYDPKTDTWTATSLSGAPSSRSDHTGIWDGSEVLIWGGYDGSSYLDTGARYNPTTNTWQTITTNNAPSGRENHTAIWTGSEMIIWGGRNLVNLNSGKRYDPDVDQWLNLTTTDAPIHRYNHSAVWDGERMIIWGGAFGNSRYNTGGRYDPDTDSWQATSVNNAPAGRIRHSAIWSGNEMVIWGGHDPDLFSDGGRYNPITDSWTAVSQSNVPVARYYHTTVWTGSQMIIWGGTGEGSHNTGGRYDPVSNSWQATATTDAPRGRSYHSMVWTGTEMIIWGGENVPYLGDGGRYRPATDSWSMVTMSNAPLARSDHSGVWSGTEMIIWGGKNFAQAGPTSFNDGGRYQPFTDSWQPTATTQAPVARYDHTAVWSGDEMIIWGGRGPDYEDTGGRYDPLSNSWTATSLVNAPDGRRRHTAVWTGSEMIVWGGSSVDGGSIYYNDGGRYDPTADTWQLVTTTNAPTARFGHSMVWSGSEVIIWAGGPGGAGNFYLTGGRYNPQTDSWISTSTTGAPEARKYHSAIWTGSEMIVWGGYFSDGFQDYFKSGGRYDPQNNSWQVTSLVNAPQERVDHTAVWTGLKMIIWGGNSGSSGGTSTNMLGAYFPYNDIIFADGFD